MASSPYFVVAVCESVEVKCWHFLSFCNKRSYRVVIGCKKAEELKRTARLFRNLKRILCECQFVVKMRSSRPNIGVLGFRP